MPRGVKGSGKQRLVKSVEERIADIDDQIEVAKARVAELNAQRKALVEEQEKAKLLELMDVMKKTNLSADDLISLAKENQT